MKIFTDNFVNLLDFAIKKRTEVERKEWMYITDSVELMAWKSYLEDIQEGERNIELED